jgi:tetratricopeptide (TPR) repeat protein
MLASQLFIFMATTVMTIENLVREVNDLRSQDRCHEALALLQKAEHEFSSSGLLYYQRAWTYDKLGDEMSAIPNYERALALGLENREDLKGCYIGLGSSYRCVGEFQKSKSLFDEARRCFPSCPALQAFEAFTLFDLGDKQIAQTQFDEALSTRNAGCNCLQIYERALSAYSKTVLKR